MQPHQPPPGWQPPPQQFGPTIAQAGAGPPTPPKGTAVAAATVAFVIGAASAYFTVGFEGLIGLAFAALCVTGGVLLLLGKPAGRVLLLIAGGLQAAFGITLIILTFALGATYDNPFEDERLYIGLGLVLFAAALLVLVLLGPTARYVRSGPRPGPTMPPYPYPYPQSSQYHQPWPPQQPMPPQQPPPQQPPQGPPPY